VEEREFSTGFATGEAAGEARLRFETTPIGRLAFPDVLRLGHAAVWNLSLAARKAVMSGPSAPLGVNE